MSAQAKTRPYYGNQNAKDTRKNPLNQTSEGYKSKGRSSSEGPDHILRRTVNGSRSKDRLKLSSQQINTAADLRKSTNNGLVPIPEAKEAANKKHSMSLSPNPKIKPARPTIEKKKGNDAVKATSPPPNNSGAKKNNNKPAAKENNTAKLMENSPYSVRNNIMLVAKQAKLFQSNTTAAVSSGDKKKNFMSTVPEVTYKYYVGYGNNGEIVKRVMGRREWWKECSEHDSTANFKWQQSTRGYKYDFLTSSNPTRQLLNHFEHHKEISTKSLLFKNLMNICDDRKIPLFETTPLTFVINLDDEAFESEMAEFGRIFNQFEEHHPNKEARAKKNAPELLKFDFRKGKYFFRNSPDTVKTLPSTYAKVNTKPGVFNDGKNMWLLKPTVLNRGRGIEIFNNLEELHNYIKDYQKGIQEKSFKKLCEEAEEEELPPEEKKGEAAAPVMASPPQTKAAPAQTNNNNGAVMFKFHTLVIQKYIEKPLLVHQRKFDIRVWVMVTHEMNAYFFKEGYLRMSSEAFDMSEKGLENKFIHLTNNAVQKYSDNYCKFENGNQLSFPMFEKYMQDNGIQGDFKGKMLPRMKELAYMSLESVRRKLNWEDRKYVFEIFGYDFIIDQDMNMWLIEVNTNPCIEESSPILEVLLPRMLDDGFKMTLDVLFPKPRKPQPPAQQNAAASPIKQQPQQAAKTQQKPADATPKEATKEATPAPVVAEKTEVTPAPAPAEQPAQEQAQAPAPVAEIPQVLSESAPPKVMEEEKEVVQVQSPAKPAPTPTGNPTPYPVPGYSDYELMWEFMGSLSAKSNLMKKQATTTSKK